MEPVNLVSIHHRQKFPPHEYVEEALPQQPTSQKLVMVSVSHSEIIFQVTLNEALPKQLQLELYCHLSAALLATNIP